MMRRLLVAALLLGALSSFLPLPVQAQVSSRGLIDPAAARQMGLERMWFTQLNMDRSRSRVAGIHQHVSATEFRTVFEFTYGGVRRTFSARELEELGRPLRSVAVLATLEEAPPANSPPGAAISKAKFKVTTVLKGPTLVQADEVLELPYVGDARKGGPFLITGSEIIAGATPPVLNWWLPLSITEQAHKHLSVPESYTAGVDRALQNAEQEIALIRLKAARLNPRALPADDQLPQIDGYVIPKITLYAASERGMIHALEGETGRTLWSVGIGNINYPTTTPGANDNFVGVVNGSQVYVLSADDGRVVWNKFTVGAPGAGPALSDSLVFVPMISGAVETFAIDEPRLATTVFRSFGRAMTQPTVTANSVAWPTDRGNLYVGDANVPDMRFRVEAKDTIDSPPAFLAPDLIFATSLDGYVYCFTERRGSLIWRFTTGEPISHSPVALGDTVYAITDRGNMYAIGAEDGMEKWLTSGIQKYLAGNERRLYCIDTTGNLAILDAQSGGLVGTLPTLALDLHVLNTQTDRILIGTRGGLIQCLRESGSHYPVIHFGEMKKKKTVAPPKTGVKPDEPADPAGDKPTDPFASPTGGDPFAAPAADKPAADKAAPKPGADPFGAPPPGADPFKAP